MAYAAHPPQLRRDAIRLRRAGWSYGFIRKYLEVGLSNETIRRWVDQAYDERVRRLNRANAHVYNDRRKGR